MDAKRLEKLTRLCGDAIADTSSGFGAYFDSQDIADLARSAAAWAKVERLRGVLDLGEDLAVFIWRDASGIRKYSALATAIETIEAAEELLKCPHCADGSETIGDGTFGGTERQSCSFCNGTQLLDAVEAAPEVTDAK